MEKEHTLTKAEKAKLEKRSKEVFGSLTNKDKRDILRYFDASLEELDELDNAVVTLWLAEGKTQDIEHYDSLPLAELEDAITTAMLA